ncbi:phosphate ABC transporter substrate-binding protein [Hwanghaeella grinnelliae]|uniref:Phosphate ABC transporter substrate-binding protein n=1 Tax=Hwanghaeella grinnelliae TaxID=2500179 RepID=A0A437QHM8_9PROT|nr:PhnD/SsuA/transferrin family substrate-binding protein [Hwanghaeella grinnelliae]RVU34052.1 phosphate ABC transporter substrate-binding protein [Hwanghaeella grinnelliae]
MTGRVSLPMYDLPGLQPVWDAWWRGMCRAMTDAGVGGLDEDLTRLSDHVSHWRDPAMRLSQTCGYPFTLGLDRDWQLVATPIFAVDWCMGPKYRNLVLVRQDDAAERLEDLKGRRVAFNSEDSHSGYNSIRWMIAPWAEKGRFFGASVQSGSHLASIKALAAGEVDCCSVDCVTFALIAKHGIVPTDGLRVVAEGPLVPGLPFITPRSTPDAAVEDMRSALMAAVAEPGMANINETLLFDGFAAVPASAYKAIAEMESVAVDQGYPALI